MSKSWIIALAILAFLVVLMILLPVIFMLDTTSTVHGGRT